MVNLITFPTIKCIQVYSTLHNASKGGCTHESRLILLLHLVQKRLWWRSEDFVNFLYLVKLIFSCHTQPTRCFVF
jgi:hypothetical protein